MDSGVVYAQRMVVRARVLRPVNKSPEKRGFIGRSVVSVRTLKRYFIW